MEKPDVAAPKFSIGQMVHYVDQHGRPMKGRVLSIRAHWRSWSMNGQENSIFYECWHPSYRNNHIDLHEDRLEAARGAIVSGGVND